MKKILLITLIILSVKGFSQVDSASVNLMINTAINQQNKTIDLQLKEIENSYKQLLISLNKKIDDLYNQNLSLEKQNALSSSQLFALSDQVDSQKSLLEKDIASLAKDLEKANSNVSDLGKRLEKVNSNVSEVSQSASVNKSEIINVSQSLTEKQKYGVYGFTFIIILALLAYIILSKKQNSSIKKINAKQKEIFVKMIEDGQQLTDWLSLESENNFKQVGSSEIDHSFAKRVADEINRMHTNLSRMDKSIRGYKQLGASVRKLEQSLNANHYTLEDLLDKPFDSGMNVNAVFIEGEDLKEGQSIITRIIKPQINYKEKLIQAADVEVSQGF